jgi:hypothetical protein
MTFKGINNQTVELKITSYQFPEITDGDWDSNWLNIYLKVNSTVGNWQTVYPALTTWDVKRLINWFDNLSNNIQLEATYISFVEPNISFELMDSFDSKKKTIRIQFNLEFRPKSAKDDRECFFDFIAGNNELKCIVVDLKKELEIYPERKC